MTRRKTDRRRRALLAEAERAVRERHGEFDLSLADVAEDVGCSPRQLQRVFREVGETDFRSYLLSVRMERARQLLSRKRGLTVREAARRCGYREASGLRQQFVRYFEGLNPSDVRSPPPDYSDLWEAVERKRSS